jgi:hypothetical protein
LDGSTGFGSGPDGQDKQGQKEEFFQNHWDWGVFSTPAQRLTTKRIPPTAESFFTASANRLR